MKHLHQTALDDPIRQLIARGRIQQEDGRRAQRRAHAARSRQRRLYASDPSAQRHRILRQRAVEREQEQDLIEWL